MKKYVVIFYISLLVLKLLQIIDHFKIKPHLLMSDLREKNIIIHRIQNHFYHFTIVFESHMTSLPRLCL